MKLRWCAALAAVLFLSLSGCGQSPKGSKAPDFVLPQAGASASSVTLSQAYQKTPVLLIFWASWCPSCVDEIPILNDIRSRYSEDKLQMYSVNVQESREQVLRFLTKNPMNYPVLLDEKGEVAALYGLVGLPASVMLAKDGEILYYGFSLPPNLDQWLEPRSAA